MMSLSRATLSYRRRSSSVYPVTAAALWTRQEPPCVYLFQPFSLSSISLKSSPSKLHIPFSCPTAVPIIFLQFTSCSCRCHLVQRTICDAAVTVRDSLSFFSFKPKKSFQTAVPELRFWPARFKSQFSPVCTQATTVSCHIHSQINLISSST